MKLKKKLGLFFLLIALLPYGTGMLFIFLSSSKTIRSNADGYFTEYTQNIANGISLFFATERSYVEAFSQYPEIRSLKWFRFLPALQELDARNDSIDTFLLIRQDGTYFRSDNPGNPALGGLISEDDTDPYSRPIDLSSRDYFQRLIVNNALSIKQTIFSNPNYSKSTGEKQIVLATNIIGDLGNSIGLFAITIPGEI